MSQQEVNFLAQIFNDLMTIEAKGESLLKLASILEDLQPFILNAQQKIRKENENGS